MRKKFHVKPGDEVIVISGNHKGKTGVVETIISAKDQVIVGGVRKIKKALRKSEQNPEGGFEERDGPIHISNVKKI